MPLLHTDYCYIWPFRTEPDCTTNRRSVLANVRGRVAAPFRLSGNRDSMYRRV